MSKKSILADGIHRRGFLVTFLRLSSFLILSGGVVGLSFPKIVHSEEKKQEEEFKGKIARSKLESRLESLMKKWEKEYGFKPTEEQKKQFLETVASTFRQQGYIVHDP